MIFECTYIWSANLYTGLMFVVNSSHFAINAYIDYNKNKAKCILNNRVNPLKRNYLSLPEPILCFRVNTANGCEHFSHNVTQPVFRLGLF